MASQRQIPGGLFVNETTTRQAQLPGSAFLDDTSPASGLTIAAAVGNATAAGVPATVTNGTAGVIIAATVGNAAAAGTAANVGTYIQSDVIINNTGTIRASQAVVWTWTPAGRIGSMSGLTPVDGTGTTDAAGRLAPGIALATGRLDVADRSGGASAKTDAVFYQAF